MLDPLILRRRRIPMVRLLFLSALLMLSGCLTQLPLFSEEESRDLPDRYEMAAAYAETHAGDALVAWEEGEIALKEGQNEQDLGEPQKIPLCPIVETQIYVRIQMQRDQSGSLSRRERRRWFRKLRRVQRRTERAIGAELTAKQVEAYRAFRDEQSLRTLRKREDQLWVAGTVRRAHRFESTESSHSTSGLSSPCSRSCTSVRWRANSRTRLLGRSAS